jgi:methylated-DNA-[protein]-cysteine S-methyltransferase
MTTLAATPVAAFTTCPAPWGMLHVAATGAGIVAVDLGSETPDFVDGLARRLHGRVLPAEDGEVPAEWRSTMDAAARQIGEWFAGRRTRFEMPIDLRVSDWDRLVLTGAARLHFGETVGYGELARRIGRPGAAQAVGGAMSRNPVPILIPCHRVIAGDGTLGGYGGSTYADRQAALAIKRRLLALEGVRPGSELGPGIEPTPRLDSRPATAENSTTPRDEHPEDGEHVTSQTPE